MPLLEKNDRQHGNVDGISVWAIDALKAKSAEARECLKRRPGRRRAGLMDLHRIHQTGYWPTQNGRCLDLGTPAHGTLQANHGSTNTASIGTQGRSNGARVAQESTINANRPNVRATIRDCLFTGSIEQAQMAIMHAFEELQLMNRMRQYVFAHMERRGQRGHADLTPEVELDKGENLPAEVAPPEGEPTLAKPDESHRRSRRQMRYKATSPEWVAS